MDIEVSRLRASRAQFGVVVAIVMLLAAASAHAASGRLDPSFGNGGIVTAGPPVAFLEDLQVLPSGQVLAAGGDGDGFMIARYDSDGGLDPAFGAGTGYTVTDIDNHADPENTFQGPATALALQPDGKVVTAGTGYLDPFEEVFVARYNADGSPDLGFNGTGLTGTPDFFASGLAIQSDGRIVVGATTDSYAAAFLRYLPSGRLDPSYGKHGRVRLPAPFGHEVDMTAMAMQPDQKLVAVGVAGLRNGDQHLYMVRVNDEGELDRSFGSHGTGVVRTVIGGASFPSDVEIGPGGRILVAGDAEPRRSLVPESFFIAGYHKDGRLDRDFGGGDGIVRSRVRSQSYEPDIAIRGHRIALAGTASLGQNHAEPMAFAVMRFRLGGKPDRSFGTGGSVVTRLQPFADVGAVALLRDGRILVEGTTGIDGGPAHGVLIRYLGGSG
jgi:uncharacterized delta-60 repeat protein